MGLMSCSAWPVGTGRIRLADNLDVMNPEEIEQLQVCNLAALVAAVAATPAAYRRFQGIELIRSAADLTQLPLMSPADLAASCPPHSNELLLGGGGDSGLVLRSSGTSGYRKVLYHSWQFNRQVGLLGTRGVQSALPDPPRRLANCIHAGDLNGGFTFVQDIGELLCALTFPYGSELGLSEVTELLIEHKVDTLVAIPSFIMDLITPTSRPPSLHTVLYIGEPMGEERERTLATIAPDMIVRSLAYSTSETGPIGYQCSSVRGTTHHIHEDAVIVEVVDGQTGVPVPNGHTGEVVVTPLTDTGMALFRYRIGDRGRLHTELCPCGSSARLLTLEGRAGQSIHVDSSTISSDLLMSKLGELGIHNPTDCQFQVWWNANTYRVRLLLSPRTPEGLTTELTAQTLCTAYHMGRILNAPKCTNFTVEHVEQAQFARSERGKIPLFYQSDDTTKE